MVSGQYMISILPMNCGLPLSQRQIKLEDSRPQNVLTGNAGVTGLVGDVKRLPTFEFI